jgi:hypothetical protein
MPKEKKWVIVGWDTYAGESYWIPGEYDTEEKALEAAKAYLVHLEITQPTSESGGQDKYGIQDRVFVSGPGKFYRVTL